jgi:hypothetical protein
MKNIIFIQVLFISLAIVLTIGCKKEDIDIEIEPVSTIGEFYQGGVTFYLDETGQHGFIAALSDLPDASWGCDSVAGMIDTFRLGTGQANTTAIINSCEGIDIAARLCNNYVSGGYDDWYLPSATALHRMFTQMSIINNTALRNGGDNIIKDLYWSSNSFVVSSPKATALDFGWVPQNPQGQYDNPVKPWERKSNIYHVRAIRAF